MTAEEIFAGESENVEFKSEIPAKSEKYMKTVVAFANGKGGKLIFGVENGTWMVTGFSKEEVFQRMDAITNAIFDSCEPKITPNIAVQEIDGKAIIVVEIVPGMQRPYYIKNQGIMDGTYIRVARTTRRAERYRVQELILEGTNRSYDQLEREQTVAEEEITAFCEKMYQHALELANPDRQEKQIQKVSANQLLSWKLLTEHDGVYHPTNGYLLLNGDMTEFPDAAIQCAVFKGTVRDIFITRKEFTGSIYEQIEDAYNFVLQHIDLDKEAIEVQKILPFLSDTWPLCRIGRAVIRASQSCRQSCNKSQCPACGCRSHHSCTHAPQFFSIISRKRVGVSSSKARCLRTMPINFSALTVAACDLSSSACRAAALFFSSACSAS